MVGGEEESECSAILRGDTRSEVFQRQPEEFTRELGGYRCSGESGEALVRGNDARARGIG